jgi:hypothetical protein
VYQERLNDWFETYQKTCGPKKGCIGKYDQSYSDQSKLLCSARIMLADKIIETASDDADCLSWLIDYLVFYVMIKNISIIWTGDITITGEGQQNLGLCSALMAFG